MGVNTINQFILLCFMVLFAIIVLYLLIVIVEEKKKESKFLGDIEKFDEVMEET